MTASTRDLEATARTILADGRGILAADESTGTMSKRLEGEGIEPTEETRRRFRELMFTTDGIEQWIGGVILYDETIRQSTSDGTPFPQYLAGRGIAPGIKVDTGAKPLAGSPSEKVTEGLDGLRERLEEYREMGARFTKWRTVINIGENLPTRYCLEVNAHCQARYAALAQEAGLVPIVEPETIMNGTHSIERSHEVTLETLHEVFRELHRQQVALEGMLLKINMVVTGYDAGDRAGVDEVAERTLQCLRQTVPAAVPGIVFLSGGQSDFSSSAHLDSMSKVKDLPWVISFSYARALQGLTIKTWAGEEENARNAQAAFHYRCRLTAAANAGRWSQDMEREPEEVLSQAERELELAAT
ncbi:MAG: fructose-bisphosphate aldolase class I [Actinobacteria bacterium]|nr:fructose-bisphosphate aldolase class I [Actinomycetota bacterium]